jgi:hypothetical protein
VLNISKISPYFCAWAEDSYTRALDEHQHRASADLAVMTAQLIIECRGGDAVNEALSLYHRATIVAPEDPDTHRIYGMRILQFWREYGVGDPCECAAHLKRARALENNDMRIGEIDRLSAACYESCQHFMVKEGGGRGRHVRHGHDDGDVRNGHEDAHGISWVTLCAWLCRLCVGWQGLLSKRRRTSLDCDFVSVVYVCVRDR